MELDQELEEDLTFKRFSSEKQEQIRQLVSYTTLLGLSGKDLISIGGRLERISSAKERDINVADAKSLWHRVTQEIPEFKWKEISWFTYKDEHNRNWKVVVEYNRVSFTLSKAEDYYYDLQFYNVGISKNRYIYNVLVNLFRGDIVLPDKV
jgi:hypothetical protein